MGSAIIDFGLPKYIVFKVPADSSGMVSAGTCSVKPAENSKFEFNFYRVSKL